MPLCSEVEQISREDLVELSEIEKHNLGQVPFVALLFYYSKKQREFIVHTFNCSLGVAVKLLIRVKRLRIVFG